MPDSSLQTLIAARYHLVRGSVLAVKVIAL
jgi:hypothetical protein